MLVTFSMVTVDIITYFVITRVSIFLKRKVILYLTVGLPGKKLAWKRNSYDV